MIYRLTLLLLLIVTPAHAAYTNIQLRRDTPTNWANYNPILMAGEPGCEMTGSPLRCTAQKIGDGVTAWANLPYVTNPWVDDRAAVALADADALAVATGKRLVVTRIWTTVPATLSASEVSVIPGGKLNDSDSVNILGKFEGSYGCFGANQSVQGIKVAYPEYWGDAADAVQRAVASGATVVIPEGAAYTAKNITLSTPNQVIRVDGTLTLPNGCADDDTMFAASGINGIRIVGTGVLDGNKAGQSGTTTQHIIRFIDCDYTTIGNGLTVRKNYANNTTVYGAVYVQGDYNIVDDLTLQDWSREGVYLYNANYSTASHITAIDNDGDSWSAVQVGGASSTHNRVSDITAKNTGASGVGVDSTYSVVDNITINGVRYQNGINIGHTGKPGSYTTVSNFAIYGIQDPSNTNIGGINIGGSSVGVVVANGIVDGSTQRGINIAGGASDISVSNVKLHDCATAINIYQAGRVVLRDISLTGTNTNGLVKDWTSTGSWTTLYMDQVDLTASTNRIIGSPTGLASPYIQYRSTLFDNTAAVEGSVSVAALGAGGTVTVTNANARANSRIILSASNSAGQSASPYISTLNDGSFVITTVNNGAAGAFVRWKIL